MLSEGDHPECVKTLLPHVDNVDEAFLQAAKYARMESLKIFVESGVNVNEKRNVTENCETNKVTALMKAASGGHTDSIEYLISKGARVDNLDKYGNNMLMFASMECKLEGMKYFINLGIDVNATNQLGEDSPDESYRSTLYSLLLYWNCHH